MATSIALALGFMIASVTPAAAQGVICNFDGKGKAIAGEHTQINKVKTQATDGEFALEVKCENKGWPGIEVQGFDKDWSGAGFLVFDVFNAGKKKIELCGWIKDDPKGGLFSRYNFRGIIAPPGKSTARIWLERAIKGNAFPLNAKNIVAFRVGPYERQGEATLYFDQFRLAPRTNKTLPDVLPILDFEEGSTCGQYELEDWPASKPGKSKITLTAEHATQGKQALRCDFRAHGGNLQVFGFEPDWSQHDYLLFDCYNDSDESVELAGWFRDYAGATYYNRFNYSGVVLIPGPNKVRFPLSGLLKGEAAASGAIREPLNRTNIVRFNLATPDRDKGVTLFFDNVRLIKTSMPAFAGPGIRKFDFGLGIGVVFPGFTPVNEQTLYDPAYGYGIKQKRVARSYEYPSDLLSDYVSVGEFMTDLPNGEYRVVFFADNAHYWEPIQRLKDRQVMAEGEVKIDEKWDSERNDKERTFRHAWQEDLPGDDHWEVYVKPRWPVHAFDVKVADGQLNLQFKGYWPLNALIICPVSEKRHLQTWLKDLDVAQRKIFDLMYTRLPFPAPGGPAALANDHAETGYTLFFPSYGREIYPNSVPRAQEINREAIHLRAALGEFEPAVVGIYPGQDLGKTTVTVSPLTDDKGYALPATTVQVFKVRYKMKRRTTGMRYVYRIEPRLLDPIDYADVPKGLTRSFYLTAHAPRNARPGTYRGTVTVSPGNGKAKTVPLQLEILPFALQEDPDFDVAFFGVGSAPDLMTNLKNLRAHGMTTTTGPGWGSWRKGTVQMGGVVAYVKAYYRAGFNGNYFVGYGSGKIHNLPDAQLAEGYKQFCGKLAELGRTKLLLILCDEPSKSRGAGVHEHYTKTIERVKKYKGVPNLIKGGFYSHIEELIPYFDVSVLGGGSVTPEFLGKIKAAGKRAWTYNAAVNRFSLGFRLAKLKAAGLDGIVLWHYQAQQGDVYNCLDGREEDHSMAFPLRDGLINAVIFEHAREGVDDFRYLYTLRTLIAKDPQKPAARDGQKLIDEILEKVDLKAKGLDGRLGGEDSYRRCDEYRARITEAILSLRK